MSHKDEQALPFFSRFLEGQFCDNLSEEEMDEISGGLTLAPKTRLDREVMTLRYPSDKEDGQPINPPVQKKPLPVHEDYVTTLKYPSDNDDWIATTPLPTDVVE